MERCQGCHGPAKQKGGLRLDSRQAALAGGLAGPAVVPGIPEKSLLIDAVNYGELYQMPPKSKLLRIVVQGYFVLPGPARLGALRSSNGCNGAAWCGSSWYQ